MAEDVEDFKSESLQSDTPQSNTDDCFAAIAT